jgi:ribonuclease R
MTINTTETFTGPLSISGKGTGYFTIPNTEESVEIQKEFLHKAFPGDTVEVRRKPELLWGKIQGEVIRVISRLRTEFVGTVEKHGTMYYLVPDDRRMYTDIILETNMFEDHGKKIIVEAGTKVVVRVDEWTEKMPAPTGTITRSIGKKGEHNTEMQAIVYEKGFQIDFPQGVDAEAEKVKEHEMKPEVIAEQIRVRRDMRDTWTCTIDPADAKDFDDALSLKKIDDNLFEIGIHIADVSHFVTPGSLLDAEARRRALSVYLVDRTIPMLPEILSNDLCSLNPHEDKYTFSAVFHITRQGEVKDKWFGRTIIHSDKRFSYEEAQAVLDAQSGEYFENLSTMRDIAQIFEKKKFEHGAINFETDEVKFILDENGKPLSVYRKQRKDTHRMIEEFMLLANREVAEYIFKSNEQPARKGAQSVYRIHDAPNKERIEDLATFLKALGFDLHMKDGEVTAKDINTLLRQVEGNPNEELIKTATIRSMAKAIYSTKNIGHFGLGFTYYAHFTSPIRRYPDLVVHRLLERELTKGKIEQDEFAYYEKVSMECSDREKQASDAERGSIKYKQVEYMMDHIGEEYTGVITGVTDWGIYIEEKETKCEGMMKTKDLGTLFGDVFDFNPKTYSITGAKTGKKITLGDTIQFKVIAADLEKRLLDYALVK